jgi:hypothetical protein
VASYQLYKYTEHQLQYSTCVLALQGQSVYVVMNDTYHKICKFVSCIFMYQMKSVELEGNHIDIPNEC